MRQPKKEMPYIFLSWQVRAAATAGLSAGGGGSSRRVTQYAAAMEKAIAA